MTDDVLTSQADYYRRRASEYDVTAYGDVDAVLPRVARIIGELAPSGAVLEIACGTGVWTQALAQSAQTVIATDAAPEVIAVARDRVTARNVTFEVADIFTWTPDPMARRFDTVFFSAWLSHVPGERFAEFWQRLRGLLAENGRVLFVDEHVDERAKERYVPGEDEIVERTLEDGRTYRIVKTFVDPEPMQRRLHGLGWECVIRRDGADWVAGEARPLRRT